MVRLASDEVRMHTAIRWALAVFVTIDVAALSWWVAAVPGHLDNQSTVGVVGTVATLAITVAGRWATQPERSASSVAPRRSLTCVVVPARGIDGVARQQVHAVDLMPGQAAEFQDRIDLLDRLAVVAGQGQIAVVCALAGQRGIGKTQLAAAYARDRIAQGWPVVVWAAAETPAGIVAGLSELAVRVGQCPPNTDASDAAHLALTWLREYSGPCLLVYDNAMDADLIRRWTPTVGAVQTVVTTTRRDFANLGVLLDVHPFTPIEAA